MTTKISELPNSQNIAWVGCNVTLTGLNDNIGFSFNKGGAGRVAFAGDNHTITVKYDTGDGQIGWSSSVAAAGDVGLARYAAGVLKVTDGTSGIRSLHGGGASVASATALPLPTGRVFHVTGTTTVTSITSTNFAAGAVITLIFDGILTFTDGSNLKLNGNFVTSTDDTITLVYDGTNWYEMCRSAN